MYSLYTNTDFDNLIKEYNYCINNIFSIFYKYYNSIKYKNNIHQISFGDEFFYNKEELNKIFKNNYHQSLINYLIDQFFYNNNLDNKNIFENMYIENIIINEEIFNKLHIYERIKALYGLNKMFPKLKNKKIIKLDYNDINNNILKSDIIQNYKYKLIVIDFDNDNIIDIYDAIKKINDFFSKKEFININNDIEILLFSNIKIKINYSNFLYMLMSGSFYAFKNIKELIIKNDNNYNIEILSDNVKHYIKEIKDNIFTYLYLGYNNENHIKFCSTGFNKINYLDIYNIFNYGYDIIRLELKYEKIMIIFNKDRTELKIINNKKDEIKTNDDIIHYYSLSYLSNFIYLQNNLLTLIIDGFDFDLNDIKNNNIKKLYINYNYENVNDIKYNNLLDIDNLNIINNFPKLEEINIGYIENNFKFIKSILNTRKYPTNLKIINIFSFQNFKKINNLTNLKLNIIYKNTEKKLIKKNKEDQKKIEEIMEEDDYENERDIVFPFKKNRKIKNKKECNRDDKSDIILIGKYIKVKSDKYLERKNIIYFNSKLIKTKRDFYLIHQCLSLIFENNILDKIQFKLLEYYQYQYESNLSFKIKDNKNIFIILETNLTEKICILLNNYNHEKNISKKGIDFCLFLNTHKVFYRKKVYERYFEIYNKDEFYKGYVSIWNADEIKFKEYNRLEELLSDIYFDFGYFENEIPKREIDESLETELKDNKIKEIEIFDILLN